MTLRLLLSPDRYRDPWREYQTEPPGFGGMTPALSDFHQSNARKRFLRAANGVGKSVAGGWEAWCHLLGKHPRRPTPPPGNTGWVLLPDLQQGWRSVSKALRFTEPAETLDPACSYQEGVGYLYRGLRSIRLRSSRGGSMLLAKGGSQQVLAMEGDRIDWLWVDEPPKREHFSGCRQRVTRTGGPIWVTMTPIGLPVGWLREMVDGIPAEEKPCLEPDWQTWCIPLSEETVPFYPPERVQQMIADIDPLERAQRELAEWDGITGGRWISAYDDDKHTFGDAEILPEDLILGIGADYGQRPGNTLWYLVAWSVSRRCLWVLGEWSPPERMTEEEEVEHIRGELLRPWGVDWIHISEARGDSNSAGDRSVAASVNSLIERAIARALRMSKSPVPISPPYKGPGSVKARARMIQSALLRGQLRIHESCHRLRQTYRHWTGRDDDLKHAFDASGYIAEVWLAPERRSSSSRVLPR